METLCSLKTLLQMAGGMHLPHFPSGSTVVMTIIIEHFFSKACGNMTVPPEIIANKQLSILLEFPVWSLQRPKSFLYHN